MDPPLRDTQLTRTSPAVTPLGLAIRRVVDAVVLTALLAEPRTIPPGAVASIVHALLAGVGSTLPALSVARTLKVCGPGANPEYACGDVHAANAAWSSWHVKEEPL